MKPIRVLVVGMTATVGGIENFLMAYCGRIDRSRVQFDFLTRFEDSAYPEKRAAIGKTYVVPRRSEEPLRYYREIRAFFEAHAHEYDVLWDNECMFNDMTPLKLAAEFGIPVRIAHSHNPQNMDLSLRGRGQEMLHRTQRSRLGRWANALWACSEHSARWACPAMDIPHAIIANAIDVKAFRHDRRVRQEVRDQYDLSDCLVVGHVGRLQYQKNQGFLLEAFSRLRQREPRARLMLVGDGPDLTDLEAKAVSLGIASDVLFLGVRDDVPRLMQAFDLFAMPSHFEGLGMAALEAQAAGLPCVLSNAVPRETGVTEGVIYLPPDDPDLWAERMLDILEETPHRIRPDNVRRMSEAGFEIGDAAQRLTERFERLLERSSTFKRRFLMTMLSEDANAPAMNKARQDVQRIASDAGYAFVELSAGDSARGSRWKQILLTAQVLWDWTRMFFRFRHGDLLLMQYPYFPVKAAPIARLGRHMLQWKGVKLAVLVHDLDSLRLIGGDAARRSDQQLLPGFDRIICHGPRMHDYLVSQGFPRAKLAQLGLFDYLTNQPMPERKLSMDVCVAGNLSRRKTRYLHELPRSKITWHLYGKDWHGKKSRTDIIAHGAFTPEELPGLLEGSFGLVWDGPSTETCRGAYGAYLMLNAPHKLSLYLASGMPVVVWAWSAQAEMVRSSGVGLVINRIADLPQAIAALSPEEYDEMARRARTMGEALRRGERTRAALEAIEKR